MRLHGVLPPAATAPHTTRSSSTYSMLRKTSAARRVGLAVGAAGCWRLHVPLGLRISPRRRQPHRAPRNWRRPALDRPRYPVIVAPYSATRKKWLRIGVESCAYSIHSCAYSPTRNYGKALTGRESSGNRRGLAAAPGRQERIADLGRPHLGAAAPDFAVPSEVTCRQQAPDHGRDGTLGALPSATAGRDRGLRSLGGPDRQRTDSGRAAVVEGRR